MKKIPRYSSILFATVLLLIWPLSSIAQYQSWVLATMPSPPEGLAVSNSGEIYTTLIANNQLMKVNMDGTYEHVAYIPAKQQDPNVQEGYLLGLDFDEHDNIYVTYASISRQYPDIYRNDHPDCRDATNTQSGIYKVDAKTRAVTPLATRKDGWAFCFPDDVAIDKQGTLYMTDLQYAGIWKISPDGKKVELWSNHPYLNWNEYSPISLGVNVLVLDKEEKNIYTGNDGTQMIAKFPILDDGSAGEPIVIDRAYGFLDGIVLDEEGNIYVSELVRSEIWGMKADGSGRVLVADKRSAPLDNNASLTYKDGMLCTANLGFSHAKDSEKAKSIVCITGFDRP